MSFDTWRHEHAGMSAEDRHSAQVQFNKYHLMQGVLMRISGSQHPLAETCRQILANEFDGNWPPLSAPTLCERLRRAVARARKWIRE